MKTLTRPLVSGSYLTISHGTYDHRPAAAVKAIRGLSTRATAPATPRRGDLIIRRTILSRDTEARFTDLPAVIALEA